MRRALPIVLLVILGALVVLGVLGAVAYANRATLCERGVGAACNWGLAQVEEPVAEEIPSNCTITNLNAMPDAENMVFSADISCPAGVQQVTYGYQMVNGQRVDLPALDSAHMNDSARESLSKLPVGNYQMFATVMEMGANVPVTEAKDFKVETPAAATPEFTATPSATPLPTFTPMPTHLPFGTVTLTTDKDEIDLGDSFTLTVVLAGDVTCTWTDGSTVVSGATKVITPTTTGLQRFGFSPDATSKCVDSNGINITSFVSVTVNPAAVVAATATPTKGGGSTSSNATFANGTVSGESHGATFTITGIQEGVEPYKVFFPGDEFGTENTYQNQPSIVFGGPGVESSEDCAYADTTVSTVCSLRSNVQVVFYDEISEEDPEYIRIREGSEQGPGHTFISAGYITAEMPDGTTFVIDTPVDVALDLWITGWENGSLSTPPDGNTDIKITRGDPSFIMGTILPPGQRINEKYRADQAIAAMTEECGNDGCTGGVIEVHYRMEDKALTIWFITADNVRTLVYQNWQ